MVTIPEIVEDIIKKSPLLEEALSSKIINLSSLARKIQPEIETKLMRSIQPGAVIMALKRLENKLSQQVISSGPNNYLGLGDLTLRSNLAEFTYKNSPTLLDKIRKILLKVDREKSSFLTFTHGLFETTLIVSKNIEVDIKQVFTKEELRSKFSDLSAITLLLPKEIVGIPGAYYQILKTLAWENINIIEVVSNYTELTIVLEDREVDKAFSALKNLS